MARMATRRRLNASRDGARSMASATRAYEETQVARGVNIDTCIEAFKHVFAGARGCSAIL